jgi:trigger factor
MTTDETPSSGTAEITITRAGDEPGTTTLKVEVAPSRVHAAEMKAAKAIAKQARLPGFRKGKVPLNVVKRQFRTGLRDEVLRTVIGEAWKQVIDDEDLKPIAEPRVTNIEFEDGAPLTFELHVDVKPEISLTRLGGFQLTRPRPDITDQMVDDQLEELRKQRAPWVPVDDGPPALGNMVSVTVATGEEDGSASDPSPYQLVMGDGQAIPELEERILEMSVGQTRDASVRYPDDFADESKRGQTRTVQISLQEIKRQDLAPLDDSFAGEVGDFESLDALRAAVREDMEASATRDADSEVRRQLMDEIIEANSLEAPRGLVQRVLGNFAQAYEVPDERLEDFAKEFGPIAARQVQRDLVLEHVAERESLIATEEDLDDRIAEIAERRGEEPKDVYASLQKSKRLRELEHSITEEKVFDYLLEQSTITDA